MARMRRNKVFIVSVVVAMLAVAGCGASESDETVSGADLEGTWIQSGAGFEKGEAITWSDQTIVIDTVEGAGFAGYKEYTLDGVAQRETLNGVVGLDGEIFMSDEDGFYEGRFEDGAFVGEYVEIGEDSTAMNVTFTRE
jgi:hypothetical protein